ncbi:MAG: response regulator [Flavobacterium sp.]|nr:MAG: response regulator [Flavobacterium sp.]
MKDPILCKLFIVDDDIFCANVYKQYLSNLNYSDITYFSNGHDCLNNLHQNPDIIFLNNDMGDLSGFEVLKKIKHQNPNIYVVMVSGQENISVAIDALKHGAFDYVIKDNYVCEKLKTIINKIAYVKIELYKSNPKIVKRFLNILF